VRPNLSPARTQSSPKRSPSFGLLINTSCSCCCSKNTEPIFTYLATFSPKRPRTSSKYLLVYSEPLQAIHKFREKTVKVVGQQIEGCQHALPGGRGKVRERWGSDEARVSQRHLGQYHTFICLIWCHIHFSDKPLSYFRTSTTLNIIAYCISTCHSKS
jgi:hypothetical protein